MNNLPKISIITPSFYQALYIEETICSVLDQKYPNLEYIILDGGSNDGSVEIIKKYSHHLSYWESKSDEGQADAINRGFEISTGDILAWINSDDTYEKDAFINIADVFAMHPEIDLVYGEGWYINENHQRLRPCRFVRDNFSDAYIANKDPILQQSAFWRRTLWNKVGHLDKTLNWVFDWDWFIRAYKNGKFLYLPKFLANYRIHSTAKTRTKSVQQRLEQREITLRYGSSWHPNAVVQGLRIGTYNAWKPIRPILSILSKISESIFYGRYTS